MRIGQALHMIQPRPTASGTVDPTAYGTLKLWYDFSDLSTMTLDGSNRIVTIADKAGSGQVLTSRAAASNYAPYYVAAAQNGLGVADLAASEQGTYMVGNTDVGPVNTLVTCYRWVNTGTMSVLWHDRTTGTESNAVRTKWSTQWANETQNADQFDLIGVPTNPISHAIEINGVADYTPTAGVYEVACFVAGNGSRYQTDIGAAFNGYRYARPWRGCCGEMWAYSDYMAAETRLAAQQAMMARWGIS